MIWLDTDTFRTVIDNTPLVSIDLIVTDTENRVLLGKRNNRPAQGCWFVPGGRIQKNETLDTAFRRLTKEELGLELTRDHAKFLGAYEHLYSDSIFGDEVSTHYVVLGYQLALSSEELNLPDAQHHEFRWWPINEMKVAEQVHENSKAYLTNL